MSEDIQTLHLSYGEHGEFTGQILRRQLLLQHQLLEAQPLTVTAVGSALDHPLEVPALRQAMVASDRIVIVLERDTPQADVIVAALWQVCSTVGIEPQHMLLLEPATLSPSPPIDPRQLLPPEVREVIPWIRHDPTEPGACTYLANSMTGVRLYLSRHLVDADLVIPVGPIVPDSLLGFRGGVSSLYPGLSETEAMRKAVGQGHQELGPAEVRPLRQLIDEVGWLLGIQFCIGVVPGSGKNAVQVLAGTPEAVSQSGQQVYEEAWQIPRSQRCELVIAAVTTEATGHTWEQLGQAAEVAQQLVEKRGRIVLLSEVAEQPGPGVKLLASLRAPKDALKPLRTERPLDVLTATRLAKAADWAQVFLLSKLPSDLVESLFLQPIHNLSEVQRLLDTDAATVVLADAHRVQIS